MNKVPNLFPSQPSHLRLALIGEAPGLDEANASLPFCGMSGRFLAALLSRAGITREQCFLGNVAQTRPPNNDISFYTWDGVEVQEGMQQLRHDLERFKPNIVVLLGNVALKAARDPELVHALKKKFRFPNANWRGSLFQCTETASPMFGYKCMGTYHPAYVLRDYDVMALFQFDLKKAVREAASPVLTLPQRTFETTLSHEEIIYRLQQIRSSRTPVALDIEGGIDTMSCISFATSPTNAFIVPIYTKDGTLQTTPQIWRELAATLEDEYAPKILQNGLYDRFVLAFSYGIRVRGNSHDTMLKHWELYSELEKNLSLQCSLYTNEPYYKGDRKSQDDKTFFEYCCRDSAVTLEISDRLSSMLRDKPLLHYQFNMGVLNPILYMECRGIAYDSTGALARRVDLQNKLAEKQAVLNGMTGHGFDWKNKAVILARRDEVMLTKKRDRCRKEYVEAYVQFNTLFKEPQPNLSTIGYIEDLCEVSLNVNSAKQFQAYLYETLKLPVQMSNVRGEEPHPTSDYEALLNLSRHCLKEKNTFGHTVVQLAIEIRAFQTRQGMLSISADKDGRIRCGYNLVGSNTGRITCYESPTGSGYNLQTIPNYTTIKDAPGGVLGDRDLFVADDGHWLFQCDLSGADGWTVAAYCAMLGDTTMLDDYRGGIKPYAKIALKLAGRAEAEWKDRVALRAFLREYKLGDIEKLTAKRVQHGGAYLEGGLTISRNVLKDSEGKHYISPTECDKLKNWYLHQQYPGITKWHDWVARRLKERPFLLAASGQLRQFFGRPDDILTKAVAFEPQANTTYATNLAAWKLWSDNENRTNEINRPSFNGRTDTGFSQNERSVIKLRIEPLHQVHDALVGQFPKSDTTWAVNKIKSYFNNPLLIAGQQITIPFEGGYGVSWGDLNEGKI